MAGGNLSPRQKMINVMYLFLTCMLALNVSKDILDAFININDNLNNTNEIFITKNQSTYNALEQAYLSNESNPQYQLAHKSARGLLEKTDSIIESIQYYKDTIIFYADKIPADKRFKLPDKIGFYRYDDDLKDTIKLEQSIEQKDNTSIPAQIMVGPEGNSIHGINLKNKFDEYREYVLDLVYGFGVDSTSELAKSISVSLNTADVPGGKHEAGLKSWQNRNFEHLPLIAVITIMTQMQAAIRNIEGDVLNLMYGTLDAEAFKFNKLEPIVLPTSTYIMRGNDYSAKIFLAAFDTTQAPIVEIGYVRTDDKGKSYIEKPYKVQVDPKTGMATYTSRGTSVGLQKYQGLIKIPKPNSSDTLIYKFDNEYQVAEPSLVVSPTKMNVFYIGPDNPVKISVPGVSSDKISASITPATHGTIRKGRGDEYVVRVSRPGTCKVAVTAELQGKRQAMGSVDFRIKRVPDPVAVVMGKEGGNITRAELTAAPRVEARMKDFDFDLRFTVQSFRVTARVGQYFVEESSNSERITHQMKQSIFNQLTRGSRLYFENVVAKGPDGRERSLGVLSFTVQ